MKQRLTYTTTTSTIWPAMPTVGNVCIIAGADYSRDNMGVLNQKVS